jgi:hypothetical protein
LPQAPASGAEGRFSRRGEDPLAELARLIGQEDPFADFSDNQRPAARVPQQKSSRDSGAIARDSRRDSHVDGRENYDSHPRQRGHSTESSYSRGLEDGDNSDLPPSQHLDATSANGRTAYSYGRPRLDHFDDLRSVSRSPRQPAPPRSAIYEENSNYDDDPRYARSTPDDDVYDEPRYVSNKAHDNDYDDPSYTPRSDNPDRYENDSDGRGYQDESEYVEDEYISDEIEEIYVEPSHGRRRWLIIGALALIGCIVTGVAGLYGYRALVGKHRVENPPTIRSGDAPNKVVPQNTAQNDGDGQKLITDRVTPAPGSERVVSREEQPANLVQSQSGRIVTAPTDPQPSAPISGFAPPPSQESPTQAAPSPPASPASSEPKRVRTMTVRSDGTVVANTAPTRATAPATTTRPSTAPLALNPSSQATPDEDTADAQPITRQTAPKTTAKNPPAQNAQQPWSGIAPEAAPQQQASYAPAGSYVVQVASQKSEADAQTAWRQMQARYTNVLGNQQAAIKRVDLGDRGTFYRAMVGPFANRDQAYEMCQNLKAAGGECVVQRN